MAKGKIIILVFILILLPLGAQDGAQPLPMGFQNIVLGLSMDETRDALEEEEWFNYRGEPDVSLLSSPNESLIDCRGVDYVSRGLFQFNEDRLYIITIILDTDRMDYHSMFTAFTEKYGEFSYLNPDMAVWENDTIRISLEKPLSVKYIDVETFQRLKTEAVRGINLGTMNRQEFIDQF